MLKILIVTEKLLTGYEAAHRDFQKKAHALVREHVGATLNEPEMPYVFIENRTLETIAAIVKAIEKSAEEQSGEPFLVAMTEIARAAQEAFEERQSTTERELEDLFAEIEKTRNGSRSRRRRAWMA
jgi:type I restriction enzyme, R subunit